MTPRAASYSTTEPFSVRAGSSMRRVIDFSDFDNGFSILPTGQSGLFGSKHYDDQTELYNQGEFKPFEFSKSAIKKNDSVRRLIFFYFFYGLVEEVDLVVPPSHKSQHISLI